MAFYGKQLESLANGVNINMTNLTLPAVLKNKKPYSALGKIEAKNIKPLLVDTLNLNKNIPDADIYYYKTDDAFLILNSSKRKKPFYYISKLWSMGKGSGTKGLQKAVVQSLKDKETKGRIFLDAENMTKKSSPAGFYYKLGFRFQEKKKNKAFENWLQNGGNRENAPQDTGLMYLPQKNIVHCLTYGKLIDESICILSNLKSYLTKL